MMRTPGFDANDIGYMQSADYFTNFLWFGYREYNPGKVFRDYGLNGSVWSSWNFGGERAGTGMNINLHFRLLNYWGGFFGFNRQMESLNVSALRGGPALKVPGRINGWFGVFSDNRKPVSLFIRAHVSRDDAGFRNAGIFPGLHVRPAGNFNFSFFVNYSTNHNDRQYVTTIEDQTGKNHYIMGHLNQNIVSFTTRINYTLTPNLSIQFYGQPFITAGKYSNFREVVHPRAARYADRFAPYDYLAENNSPDFNFKQFRSNLVIRWEYRPGSTLFLVWSQGRTNVSDNGNFDFSRDFTSLLKTNGDNVFLIKLNRWLSL
ncbi:MAG TPA: hypothetical protein ENG82_04360 [Bacteroidetes bacterium]|nr:hypothetical protein [Bacteroidota bacterium]